MDKRKRVALVAHDNCKADLIEWVEINWQTLHRHDLTSTGTTGSLVEHALKKKNPAGEITIHKLKSGPLGGDQQLGALIAEEKIDVVFFFWDPMHAQAHDVDVKALLRICVLYNVVTASNRATADFVISSPLFDHASDRRLSDFREYTGRFNQLK